MIGGPKNDHMQGGFGDDTLDGQDEVRRYFLRGDIGTDTCLSDPGDHGLDCKLDA